METIYDKIWEATNQAIIKRNIRPTRIYLGTIEWKQLVRYVNKIPSFKYEATKDPELNGLKIFVVSSETHLFVA